MAPKNVRNGIRTHAHICGSDLKPDALDRSATLTTTHFASSVSVITSPVSAS